MEKLLTISQTALPESQEINENLAKADSRKDPESQTKKKKEYSSYEISPANF